MKLLGKKALVTGAARGIGRGCALELARAGADVAVNDRERSAQAEAVATEIRTLGRHAVLIDGDIFVRSSCERVVAQALEELGQIDILISNPAFSRRGDFLEYDPEIFEKTLQGTLASGFHMSQFIAKQMVAQGRGGKIVFISSVHARIPYARSVAYNAAKSGLNHMALTIAAELSKHRINVNVIEPGWIDTPGEHDTFGSEAIRQAAPSLPWGRLGTPEDIGKAAVFLSSADADYITGACLLVDGGFCLRRGGGWFGGKGESAMNFDSYKANFDRDGFVIVRQFLPKEEWADLSRNLDRYIREVVPKLPDSHAFYIDKSRPETLKQMQHMGGDAFFRDYTKHPTWCALARTLVGEEANAEAPEWFNKPPGTTSPTPPHQDNYYFCLAPPNVVTIWLALDPVDEENGCLRYVAGSHVRGIRPHGRTSVLGFSQGIADYGPDDRAREVQIHLQPGDAVVHHGNTIHRAEPNRTTSRNRRGFAMVFKGISCRRDADAFARYQAALEQQHKALGLQT